MTLIASLRIPIGLRSGILLATIVCAIDQVSKHLVMARMGLGESVPVPGVPFLSLTFHHNFGTAMNIVGDLGEHGRMFIIGFSLLVSAFLCWMMVRASSVLNAVPLGLICGGAVGNLLDRLRFGYVIDFIHVHAGGWSFYIFNAADSAITIGAVMLLLLPQDLRAPIE